MNKISHTELAEELKRQNHIKKDFVVPYSALRMDGNNLQIVYKDGANPLLSSLIADTGISIANGSESAINLKLTEVAHDQIAEKLGIHRTYYQKMLMGEHFPLLNENVNHWLSKIEKNFFIRTFIDPTNDSGICRAFLSDRFFALDNFDIFFATLEAVRDSGIRLEILDCDITDKRMYVRFVAPDIEVKSPELLKAYRTPDDKGNSDTGIMSGFVLSNSEVGWGKFSISPRAVINACSNGMIWREDAFSETHLGSKMEECQIQWSHETFQNEKALIISQIKDWVKTFINLDYLGKKISKLEMQGKEALAHPIDTVHNVCVDVRKKVYLSDEKEQDLLNYFVKGGCMTGFGVSQAITYFAQHNANPDDQYELEMVGVDVLNNIKQYDKPATESKKKSRKNPTVNLN